MAVTIAPLTATVSSTRAPGSVRARPAALESKTFLCGGSRRLSPIVAPQTLQHRRAGRSSQRLVTEANIFSRFGRVIRSYTNSLLNRLEDPEKILDQTVTDMQNDLVKLRQATAQVMAAKKRLETKYSQAQDSSNEWYRRAQLALQKGDETLAKEALVRKKSFDETVTSLEQQLQGQNTAVEKLIANTRLLESKVSEAKTKKETLKARAASAKTQQKVNELAQGIDTSSSLGAFEKMEEKVMSLEAEADSVSKLQGDDVEAKFKALEGGSVDSDLEKLKQDMLKDSSTPKQLPGRPISEAMDPIDKELEELRKKTKDL